MAYFQKLWNIPHIRSNCFHIKLDFQKNKPLPLATSCKCELNCSKSATIRTGDLQKCDKDRFAYAIRTNRNSSQALKKSLCISYYGVAEKQTHATRSDLVGTPFQFCIIRIWKFATDTRATTSRKLFESERGRDGDVVWGRLSSNCLNKKDCPDWVWETVSQYLPYLHRIPQKQM